MLNDPPDNMLFTVLSIIYITEENLYEKQVYFCHQQTCVKEIEAELPCKLPSCNVIGPRPD